MQIAQPILKVSIECFLFMLSPLSIHSTINKGNHLPFPIPGLLQLLARSKIILGTVLYRTRESDFDHCSNKLGPINFSGRRVFWSEHQGKNLMGGRSD
jgi:hypothetical protein